MPVPRPKSTRHRQNKPGKLSAGHTGAVEIGVALEAVKAVQHQDLVIVVVGDELVQPVVVVAEIHHIHGNNGLSRVEGDGEGKILVIKDSYANSFVPYLTANYAAIDVVDFRNYNYGLDQLIAANDYDQILVLYSYASFTTDPYLYRAGVAG